MYNIPVKVKITKPHNDKNDYDKITIIETQCSNK